MATRKSTPGTLGRKSVTKEELPAMRRRDLEATLCDAIRKKLVVRLRYKTEMNWRTYEPHAVFCSSTGKINVSGTQTKDQALPNCQPEPRFFEVGLIKQIEVTMDHFEPDYRFNSFSKEYASGVVCAVDRNNL